MAGTEQRVGWYTGGGTPDLAHVVAGTQRVFVADLAGGSGRIVFYGVQVRVGSTGGTKRGRIAIWSTTTGQGSGGSSSAVPDQVIAETEEFTTSATFTGSNEGETRTLYFKKPFVGERNARYALGATSRDNNLVIGMVQAASIPGAHNTWLYDKSVTNGNPARGYTSTVNAGHLAITLLGEPAVSPTAPTSLAPSGSISNLWPRIEGNFNDTNKTLNSGHQYDRAVRVHMQVRRYVNQQVVWDQEWGDNQRDRTSHVYSGLPLLYNTTYEHRMRHRDIDGGTTGTWGTWSGWVQFTVAHTNRAPNRPGEAQILGGATNRQPTIRNGFSDPDETLPNGQAWDYINGSHHEIYWGGSLQWSQTFNSTAAERSGRYSERQIGIQVPYGVPVDHWVYHIDRSGAWSQGRKTTFTVHSGAGVDQPVSPSGRIVTPANPGNIVATYRNSGSLNTSQAEVRLINSARTPLAFSGPLSRNVAPNANVTVTWAQSGFGTMPNGVTRGVQMQVWDSNGVPSGWSDPVWFTTNAAPSQPTVISPISGTVASELQNLTIRAHDPDQPITELSASVQLYAHPSGTAIGAPQAMSRVGTDGFEFDPSSLISTHQTFTWQAVVNDGYLNSPTTPLQMFTYAAVPNVTITAPTGPTITTATPTFAWISTNQTHWRLRGYDGARLVYDTGEQAGSAQEHTLADMYWVGGERWNNLEEFQWDLKVRDTTTLWGSAALLSLTLEYIPPDTIVINAGVAESLPGISGTHYHRVSINQSGYAAGVFQYYRHRRIEVDGENGQPIPYAEIRENIVTSPDDIDWLDFEVKSGQWYRHIVTQVVRMGIDIVESEPASIDIMAEWHGTLLHSNADPLNSSVWLNYGPTGGGWGERLQEMSTRSDVWSSHRSAPHAYLDDRRELSINGEYTLLANDSLTAQQQLDNLYRVNDWQKRMKSPNGRPNGICYRSGRGGSRGLLFVTMDMELLRERTSRQTESVAMVFREYHRQYVEGGV